MECWNLGISAYAKATADRLDEGLPLEGRALSRPATTKRGPPKHGIQFPRHSHIPAFQLKS